MQSVVISFSRLTLHMTLIVAMLTNSECMRCLQYCMPMMMGAVHVRISFSCIVLLSLPLLSFLSACPSYLCSNHITMDLLSIFPSPPFAGGSRVQMFCTGCSIVRHLLIQVPLAFLTTCDQSLEGNQPVQQLSMMQISCVSGIVKQTASCL